MTKSRSDLRLSLAHSAIGVAAALWACAASASYTRKETIGGLEVTVWLPDVPRKSSPAIIFSHGYRGCATQSTFLTEALADEGYVVFAPNHKDQACHNLAKWLERPSEAFFDIDSWNDTSFEDRRDDVRALLDAAPKNPRYAGLDWQQVGIVGHSLGGYTALALAGAWPTWKDSRIKAVVALSPFVMPLANQKTLQGIEVPVMYQGGTRDVIITPAIAEKGGAYDQTLSPKIWVEFDGAGHLAWTDLRSPYHDPISDYTIAFFDHCLKNKPFTPSLPKGKRKIAHLRSKM